MRAQLPGTCPTTLTLTLTLTLALALALALTPTPTLNQGYKKADAQKKDFWSCEPDCAHEPQCEHAIIMEAQKAEGTWRGPHAELNHVDRAPWRPELPRELVLERQQQLSPI